jgi:hypothetical protein
MTTATRPPFVIPPNVRPGLHKHILEVLQGHCGHHNAIKSPDLARAGSDIWLME